MMSDLNEIQRTAQQQFDRQSPRYGKGHIVADVADVKGALGRLPWLKPGRALDVATGAGHTGLFLAGAGWQVTLSRYLHGDARTRRRRARTRTPCRDAATYGRV